jgi:hypothetical protein
MKWILYVMLFNTPAVNITSKAEIACLAREKVSEIGLISLCRPDFEGKHVWSLQTASQLEFSTLESCVKHQDQLIANSNVASTMTLRSWCFCDSDKEECPTDKQADDAAAAIRICEIDPKGPTCQEHLKNSRAFFGRKEDEKGQNSASVRLYPPPKRR